MDRFEFERDLDYYISKRRTARSSFFSSFFGAKKVFESKSKEPEPQPLRVRQPVEVQVSQDPAVASEYESNKKGAFSKIFSWVVSGSPEKHDAVVEPVMGSVLVEKELLNDMRQLAQISILTFRKLPAHKIREFKESADYSSFKGILKKHGLSKE